MKSDDCSPTDAAPRAPASAAPAVIVSRAPSGYEFGDAVLPFGCAVHTASRGHGALRVYDTDRGVLICAADDRLRMLVSRRGRRVTLDYDEADDYARSLAEALRVNLGASVAALLRGEFPLHCAAVEIEGRQVAVMAATGAGKTTLLWHTLDHGARLVCDDVLLLQRGGGSPVIGGRGAATVCASSSRGGSCATRSIGRTTWPPPWL